MAVTRRNVVANYFGQAWVAIMGLAFVPIYLRYLGTEAYGVVGLFAVLLVWFTVLDMGMTPTLNREMARLDAGTVDATSVRDLLRSFEWIMFGLGLLIVGSMALISKWVATQWLQLTALDPVDVQVALLVMALVAATRLMEAIYRSGLLGLQRQSWYNGANMVMATLRSGGAALVVAFVSPTILAFFIWQALVSAFALLVMGGKLYRLLPVNPEPAHFSMEALAAIRHFAGGMLAITLLSVLLTQTDKLLLSRLLPLEQFTYYMLASAVVAVLYMLVMPITQALLPVMVGLAEKRDTAGIAARYHTGAQMVAVVLGSVAFTLAFHGSAVVFAWTGDRGIAAAVGPILGLMALGTLANGLMQLPYHAMVAHGRTRLFVYANLIAVACLVPLILTVVPVHGAIGAAAVWLGLNLAYIVLLQPIIHGQILPGELRTWAVFDTGLPLAGAAVAAMVTALVVERLNVTRIGSTVLPVASLLLSAGAALLLAPRLRSQLSIVQVLRTIIAR